MGLSPPTCGPGDARSNRKEEKRVRVKRGFGQTDGRIRSRRDGLSLLPPLPKMRLPLPNVTHLRLHLRHAVGWRWPDRVRTLATATPSDLPPSKTSAKREARAWRAAADAASDLTPAAAARLDLPPDAAQQLAHAAALPRRNQARKRHVGMAARLLSAEVEGDAAAFAAAVGAAADGRAAPGAARECEWLACAWRDALVNGGDPAAADAAYAAAETAAADGRTDAPGPGALRALVRAAVREVEEREAADAAAAAAAAEQGEATTPPPRRQKKGAPAGRDLLRGLRPLAEEHMRRQEEEEEEEEEEE